ncbi:TPA: Ail/Lom family outer membrane beta-barrel protein [Enterobacter chengduensis]|uniref:Virulence protein n=1 Tax=Enterobacter chengduensis TaxID=2494701 RepID=A0AAW3HD36_9ENTR|nr:Ail/Lom family outer membrane beta-barrel protein [Enterobacter chengduensis]KDF39965.1 hypothetical protein AE07_04101 [Enterobacter cloacae BWH 43]OTW36222.1 virulence protein [Enterobacter kobei]GJL41016.1 virulence-related membrane protein [Enterobacter asburiae]KJX33728.1 virulence protein [Enterobacter chengduensis]MBN9879479.1 Ail/Lom family outer membrane beta-barrel protein [Enterobacter chengduensis]
MNKISLAIILATSVASSVVFANEQTLSLGYAHADVQNFNSLSGVNLQYRYEFNSPLSIVGSFTYMQGDGSNQYYVVNDFVQNDADVKYYSVLAGPAYRINNYLSLYALAGVSYVKATGSTTWINSTLDYTGHDSISLNSTSFAYGAGLMVNPVENISVTIGYEGTNADLDGNYAINGFNLGIGYRF